MQNSRIKDLIKWFRQSRINEYLHGFLALVIGLVTPISGVAYASGGIRVDTFANALVVALPVNEVETASGYQNYSMLPEWPKEFGEAKSIARASRWPGYKAVMGPDSTIWCFTLAGSSESEGKDKFVLTRINKDMTVKESLEIECLQGDIVDFDVAVGDDRAILFWAEKRGDDYHLLARQIKFTYGEPGGSLDLTENWQFLVIKSVVADVSVSISGDRIFFGWIDQEEGRPGAFIIETGVDVFEYIRNGNRNQSERKSPEALRKQRIRLSGPDVSVISLKLVPAPDGVWAVWVQAGQIVNQVMLSPYLNGSVKSRVQIAETTSRDTYGIAPLISDDGLCHLVFVQGRVFQGTLGRQAIVYGIIDNQGLWVMEPANITQGEGYVSSPSTVFINDDLAIAWSDNRDGKFQVHSALVQVPVVSSSSGNDATQDSGNTEGESDLAKQQVQPALLSYGAATLSSKECLYPHLQVFEDETKGIVYQVYQTEGDMLLKGVSSLDPKQPGWAYFLGLDLENPLQDGLFKFINVFAAALAITFLAIPSLAAGLILTVIADKLKLFSETCTGVVLRLLFLFGVIFLLKKPGAWFYLFAPVLPQGLSWLSFGLASLATICLDVQSTSHARDILPTVLAGTLFIFFDSLFSVIVKGVGLF